MLCHTKWVLHALANFGPKNYILFKEKFSFDQPFIFFSCIDPKKYVKKTHKCRILYNKISVIFSIAPTAQAAHKQKGTTLIWEFIVLGIYN